MGCGDKSAVKRETAATPLVSVDEFTDFVWRVVAVPKEEMQNRSRKPDALNRHVAGQTFESPGKLVLVVRTAHWSGKHR